MKNLFLLLAVVLAACAGMRPDLDTSDVDREITPTRAATAIEQARGHTVLWGGAIMSSRNLKNTTEIEVLGAPLDDLYPNRSAEPQHRFIIVQQGYLETADYKPGRLVTVVGSVREARAGTVGDARYVFPIVDARQLHLWPVESERRRSEPKIHFGVGVIFH